jgi:sugar phosphate isomerase/epimerase
MGAPLAHAAAADADADVAKTPRLLVGCCAYSYREALTQGKMTLEDFIVKAVELKVDAIDMTVYYLKSTDPGYLENLRYLAYKNAVALSGAACGSSFVQADPAKRDDVIKQVKSWIDVTDRLGASHLRVFAGTLPKGVTMQQATDWVVEGMKVACDYAAPKGIRLGLEDHSGVSQSADVCLEIMHRVNSPFAGINLDITHFIPSATQDSYAQIAACLPYATVSHIRDRFDDKSPIDMDRVWKLYADAGHKGYMSLEYEGEFEGGEPFETGIPRVLAEIKTLCRKYSSV